MFSKWISEENAPRGENLARFCRPGGWGIHPSKNFLGVLPGGRGYSGLELTDTLYMYACLEWKSRGYGNAWWS